MTFCFRFSIASALSLESILLRQSSHLHRDVQTPLLWKHLQYDFKHWLCLQLQNYPLSANRRAFFIWMQVSQHDYFKHISVLAKKQGHSILASWKAVAAVVERSSLVRCPSLVLDECVLVVIEGATIPEHIMHV